MKYLIILFSIVPSLLISSPNPTGCENSDWVKIEPVTSPRKRAYHAMAYDAESDRVILFSGDSRPAAIELYSDTWAYDYNSSQWTKLNPENSPPKTSGHAMAYDIESDRIILFSSGGGSGWYADGTWAFDFNSNSWTEMKPLQKPLGRFGCNMAYDAESDRIILFGGSVPGLTQIDDTWSYDINADTWTKMNPPTSPPARQYHSMVYDSESDRIILFGGASGNKPGSLDYLKLYDDTWAYDFNSDTWTQMMPDTYPSARVYTDMAYNEKCDRVVLFGGGTESFREIDPDVLGHGNETWMYDYNSDTWQQVINDQAPTYRKKHKLAYDIESDRLILFGGDSWNSQGQTIGYQYETWVREVSIPIPDPSLEAALRVALGKPTGIFTAADMESLTGLDAAGRDIRNLAGLEKAINLTAVDLRDNEIRDFIPLVGLNKLQTLGLSGNYIKLTPGSYSRSLIDTHLLFASFEPQRPLPEPDGERLVNLSTRGWVGTGDTVLIDGFVLTGNEPTEVMIRGIGPALQQFGFTTALSDPVIQIHRMENGGIAELVAENDDWSSASVSLATEFAGAFQLEDNSSDAAVFMYLEPGIYTVILSGKDGADGIGMIEVYEIGY